MQSYIEMVKFRRPHGSTTEEIFINRFIRPLGVEQDSAGNLIKRIGTAPVLWSCHTDTVHGGEGLQRVVIDGDYVRLHGKEKKSSCLGADCTTGVWLMVEMIKAGVEGLYIFHRGEECGAHGSRFVADEGKDVVKDIKFAIAFDRYGTKSVITHQFGKCASDEFADSLILQLDGYKRDENGVFTDTANYVDIIQECTNLSVGYYSHHTKNECQDLRHMTWLLDKMINLKVDQLACVRDVTDQGWMSRFSYGGTSNRRYGWADFDFEEDHYVARQFAAPREQVAAQANRREELVQTIVMNPDAVADLLEQYGIGVSDLKDYIFS